MKILDHKERVAASQALMDWFESQGLCLSDAVVVLGYMLGRMATQSSEPIVAINKVAKLAQSVLAQAPEFSSLMPKRFHVFLTVNTPSAEYDHGPFETDSIDTTMQRVFGVYPQCTSMVITASIID